MHKAQQIVVGALALIALAAPVLRGQNQNNDANQGNRRIDLVDDCNPADPAWTPTGGCFQKDGDVTAAEFNLFLRSPLYANPNLFLVGHPSWRNEPSHVVIEAGKKIDVRNVGGRPHTLTQVAQFGGGVIPPLNVGTTTAPECLTHVRLEAGDRDTITADGEGIQRYMCCFHPWMRATVRVVAKDQN